MPWGYSNKQRAAAQAAALLHSTNISRTDPPVFALSLWPNRSLGKVGLRNTMWVAAIGLLVPVLPFLATPAALALLPFVGGVFIALWFAFRHNYKDAELTEYVYLWPDMIAVERHELTGEVKHWQSNPYWMQMKLLPKGGPVANYLTLKSSDHEIELGRFLSPKERTTLRNDIENALRDLGQNRGDHFDTPTP